MGFELFKLFAIFVEDGLQVAGVFEEVDELVDDFGFEGEGGDGVEITGAFVFGAGAVVAQVIGAVALFGGESIERGVTASTVGDAGEEVVGSGRHPAGVMLVASEQVLVVGVKRLDVLDGVPCFAVYDGLAVVVYDYVPIFEDANIDLVAEEAMVLAESGEDVGGVVDLGEGMPGGFHLVGLLDAVCPLWIGNPFIELAHFAGAGVEDGGEGLALDAGGGCAEHGFGGEQ